MSRCSTTACVARKCGGIDRRVWTGMVGKGKRYALKIEVISRESARVLLMDVEMEDLASLFWF